MKARNETQERRIAAQQAARVRRAGQAWQDVQASEPVGLPTPAGYHATCAWCQATFGSIDALLAHVERHLPPAEVLPRRPRAA